MNHPAVRTIDQSRLLREWAYLYFGPRSVRCPATEHRPKGGIK